MPANAHARIAQAFSRASTSYDNAATLQRAVLHGALKLARDAGFSSGEVLDLGCGTGRLAAVAAAEAFKWEITALDLAYAMCNSAHKAEISPSMVVNGQAEQLPFDERVFDLVIASLMLQWVEDSKAVFTEMARVLKPGGAAIVTTFGPATLNELKTSFAAVDDTPRVNDFLAKDALEALTEDTGLIVEQSSVRSECQGYADVKSLLVQLKALGATSLNHPRRKRGLATPALINRMSEYYASHFATPDGVAVTWEIIELTLRRP